MGQNIPEVEYGWTESGRGWYALCKDWTDVDVQVAGRESTKDAGIDWWIDYAAEARWGGQGWLIYPGEYVDGDEQEGIAPAVRDMLSRVNVLEPPNTICKVHAISSLIPHIRLGIAEHFEDIRKLLLYHRFESGLFSSYSTGEGEAQRGNQTWRIMENQFQGILCVTEMMLQSQGDVIRLFPYLPQGIGASFNSMLARGGFEVSASRSAGNWLDEAVIVSRAGQRCRIRWEQQVRPVIECCGKPVAFERDGRDIVFETGAGCTYRITAE